MFIFSALFYILLDTYKLHDKKVEFLALQFNSIIYEFYLNIKLGNVNKYYKDDITSSGLIKDMYVYYKKTNKVIHVLDNQLLSLKECNINDIPIKVEHKLLHIINDFPYKEMYYTEISVSVLYDEVADAYSIIDFNIPYEYMDLQTKTILIFIILSFFIIMTTFILYRRYNKDMINDKVSETVNLFKDTSFIVSNFNHEINTPLTSIESSLYILSKESDICNITEKKCERISTVNKEIKNISNDIKFIKNFIDKINTLKMINSENIGNQNLFDSLKIIQNTVSNITTTKMEVSVDKKFKDIQLKISGEYLYSIFLNLIKNSYEADASYVNIYTIKNTGDQICIMYKDNGSGIKLNPPEQIFGKYNSSKSSKHTQRGFGMFFIKTILESNKGQIKIVKTDKYGTEFRINLPYELYKS